MTTGLAEVEGGEEVEEGKGGRGSRSDVRLGRDRGKLREDRRWKEGRR